MQTILKIFFPLLALGLLVFTWSVSIQANGGLAATFLPSDPTRLTYNLFRLAGLTAFSLVSFQILTGPFMKLWERLYGPNFYRFHAWEGVAALILALTHPSLMLLYLAYKGLSLKEYIATQPYQYYFGPIALTLLLITVSTAFATIILHSPRFAKTWHWFHLANYAVFLLVFFHSLAIGTDVAPAMSPLRPLWNLYFVGLVFGLVYRRVIRLIQEKNQAQT